MGHYNRGQSEHFYPDNTEKEFYLEEDATLSDIIEKVKEHFGDEVSLHDVTITPEHIHTDYLTYDVHDPSDYTDFIKVSIG